MKTVSLRQGMTIDRALSVKSGTYTFGGDGPGHSLSITGSDYLLEFLGSKLCSVKKLSGDMTKGTGVLIKGARGVSIAGLDVSWYHRGIQLEDCEDVTLIDCDASDNGQRKFRSTDSKYDKRDFLDIFHYKVWSKYGAGIYLKNCKRCRVINCVAKYQLNGIILDGCEDCLIEGNVCTDTMGWGIRLWSSSNNRIIGNDCRRCVSGESAIYSHGNDSAGIVMVNACHHNLISGNDLRHSGDGFFLTADLGTEQSNDNLIVGNDGSHAPHNPFESTFCLRNKFYNNKASHSHYGFWMGFSCDNELIANEIEYNRAAGVAIEHGRGNRIIGNRFRFNREYGILLFRRRKDGPASEHYQIIGNEFDENFTAVEMRLTSHCVLYHNSLPGRDIYTAQGWEGPNEDIVVDGVDVASPDYWKDWHE